jgi:hypothetical protein
MNPEIPYVSKVKAIPESSKYNMERHLGYDTHTSSR